MAISTKKIYAAQFIRCCSTFIIEFITELDDFDGLVNTHFFSDKIFKDQTAVCTYREPTEWYFSQWNYARQRHRGEFHRLINSKIFRFGFKSLRSSINPIKNIKETNGKRASK